MSTNDRFKIVIWPRSRSSIPSLGSTVRSSKNASLSLDRITKIISPRPYYQYRCEQQSRTTHLILSKGTFVTQRRARCQPSSDRFTASFLGSSPRHKQTFRFDIDVDRGLEPSKGTHSHWRKPNRF